MSNIDKIENYLSKFNIRGSKTEYHTSGNTSCDVLLIRCYPNSWVTTDNLEELLQVKFPEVKYKRSLNDMLIYDTIFSY